ncbi:HAD-like domain-containing protein [Roridomyces roridus]|uniref:HAD-like domain-containing protein n=1 Tax=Roridomyces roridus TaxID=1738132 RepID=A0AAD7FV39_9AGAR|nr:HAD-like domain-containing protein [Roridomyces roridus]
MITLWLDIDNTLYSAQSGISAHMGKKIHQYFLGMGLEEEEASALHLQYYTKYGLALRGLMLHHDVDPLDFDRKCDQSLPLEDLIKPDPALRKLLQDIDRSKIRLHAERVLRILNLDDQIEGLIFCDYTQPNFSCKPDPEFYHQAMEKAGVTDPSTCYL